MLVSPEVLRELDRFVWHTLWTDEVRPHGEENQKAQKELKSVALPLWVLYDADGNEAARLPDPDSGGVLFTTEQFLEALRKIR